jgi:hypothetical protein
LLQAAFFDLIGAESLERVRLWEEGDFGEKVNEPFCGVVLVPYDCVAVVAWEFVVEVVVARIVVSTIRSLSFDILELEKWTYPSPIVTSAVNT